MPIYHFNLFNDVDTVDEEGSEHRDLAAAKAKAIAAARELIGGHVIAGNPINLADRIEIADEHGKVLVVIPFREVLTLVDRGNERD